MGTVQYDGPMRYTFKAKENRIMNVIGMDSYPYLQVFQFWPLNPDRRA